MTMIIILFIAFFVKHFVIDFPLQLPYMWMNKGKYLHPGGILHAALHGLWTFVIIGILCSSFVPLAVGVGLAALDFFVHYHIDWVKMNINSKMGWKCNEHPQFWTLTGLDQLLHYLTYAGIIYIVSLCY